MRTKSLCVGHYEQLKKGQELRPLKPTLRGVPRVDRFMAKVKKTDTCWLWTSPPACASGYGQFAWATGRMTSSHRAAYELFKGEIPVGMTIDHECQNRLCVNPAHLRLATSIQNSQYKRRYKTTSRTGVRNVRVAPNNPNKFEVNVECAGVVHYGGRFDTLREADIAAGKLRNELFDFKEMPIE